MKQAIIYCQNCKKHKATVNWVGQGSVMDYVHGNYTRWCECCCLKEQIKNIRETVGRLPKLEKKLANLKCK